MTQPRDYITIVDDKRREKEEEKKKEEKAGRMCTSYRSDTIIEITVNDRQGEDDVYPNLWRIHVYAGLRMHISQKFERFRVPH